MANYKRRKARINCTRAIRGSTTAWRAKWRLRPVRIPDDCPDYRSIEWDWMWHPRGRHGNTGRKISGPYSQMSSWPKRWDILHHTRPKRRAGKALETKIMKGYDADEITWPLGNHKPHTYYW